MINKDKIIRFIKNPYIAIARLINKRECRLLPDRLYIQIKYRAAFGRPVNWKEPVTFNEKLQWLKLYDRNPFYSELVDKFEVKNIVARKIGQQYVIPTLGVWDSFNDIPFDDLPEQFVLKCTHDSGGLVIVKSKKDLDMEMAKNKISSSLKRNFYWLSREWPYKAVKPRVIAEQYVEVPGGDLKDYKFFCFGGEPKYLFVASDRNKPGKDVKFDYFDIDFHRLNLRQSVHENSNYNIERPTHYEEMIEIARKLSKGFPQLRVDLYEANGQVYFGELTFFHHGGFVPFIPEYWDFEWGNSIVLPEKRAK